ncbi:MAG: ATP-binding cassette domain-containing protein [Myxococcota bacterium]
MIEFRGLHKSFGAQHVLRGMDLRVLRGEILFIIGTSGVGKSVTIKHVVGLLRPDAGEVRYDGRAVQDLPERDFFPIRMRCGMVFQSSTLFDSLTLRENVALPLLKHRGLAQADADREALARLEIVHMAEFCDRYPAELGDGMRKRAAIARTLALDPEAVLFDEPTTGLDPVSARRVDRLIAELSRERGKTCVVVSHDLRSIFGIADRIAFLYQGRVHALGTPAEFRATTDPIVRQFVEGRSDGPMETPGF